MLCKCHLCLPFGHMVNVTQVPSVSLLGHTVDATQVSSASLVGHKLGAMQVRSVSFLGHMVDAAQVSSVSLLGHTVDATQVSSASLVGHMLDAMQVRSVSFLGHMVDAAQVSSVSLLGHMLDAVQVSSASSVLRKCEKTRFGDSHAKHGNVQSSSSQCGWSQSNQFLELEQWFKLDLRMNTQHMLKTKTNEDFWKRPKRVVIWPFKYKNHMFTLPPVHKHETMEKCMVHIKISKNGHGFYGVSKWGMHIFCWKLQCFCTFHSSLTCLSASLHTTGPLWLGHCRIFEVHHDHHRPRPERKRFWRQRRWGLSKLPDHPIDPWRPTPFGWPPSGCACNGQLHISFEHVKKMELSKFFSLLSLSVEIGGHGCHCSHVWNQDEAIACDCKFPTFHCGS